MADVKETSATTAAAASQTAAKAETVVKEAAKDAAKEAPAAAKAEPKKRGRKPGSTTKKTATKKPTATKKTATAKKAPSKRGAKSEAEAPVVILQFYGEDANVNDIIARVTDGFVNEGHRASSIKKLQVYLKPEERAAYYVINDKQAGKVDLF